MSHTTTQISAILGRMEELTFNEDDVRSLFTHLRDGLIGNELVREMGDFYAHPKRDKGVLHKLARKKIDAWAAHEAGQKVRHPKELTFDDFRASVRKELRKRQLDLSDRANLCLMAQSIASLQTCSLAYENEVLPLDMSIQGYSIMLSAVKLVPPNGRLCYVLMDMPNVWGLPDHSHHSAEDATIIRLNIKAGNVSYVQEAKPLIFELDGSDQNRPVIKVAPGTPFQMTCRVFEPDNEKKKKK